MEQLVEKSLDVKSIQQLSEDYVSFEFEIDVVILFKQLIY